VRVADQLLYFVAQSGGGAGGVGAFATFVDVLMRVDVQTRAGGKLSTRNATIDAYVARVRVRR
jgi:hypothetical protein